HCARSLFRKARVVYAPCLAHVKQYVWFGFSRAGEAHMPDKNERLTMSVPEAGKKYFDLSRDASYAAAQRGDIPTIRVGRLLRVPVRAMERLLDGVDGAGAALVRASPKWCRIRPIAACGGGAGPAR